MRLSVLRNGYSFLQKAQIKVISAIAGQVPGPIYVLSHRRQFFGKHYVAWLQRTMRKMNNWTVGEVELMATYISKSNECQFCSTSHTYIAAIAMERQLIQAVVDNAEIADVDEKLKAILLFLKKLTTNPSDLTKEDITILRNKGLSKEAIAEAIHVCGALNVMNRLADAFDFDVAINHQKGGALLYKVGYGIASLRG
jgi:uncharacterized peroxidase-related enzyme